MPDDGYRYELVRGVLKKMAPVGQTGDSTNCVSAPGLPYMLTLTDLARHTVPTTGFLLERNPDYVLAPDAAFVRQERVEAVREECGYFSGAPDFVAEVISPTDRYTEVEEKVA